MNESLVYQHGILDGATHCFTEPFIFYGEGTVIYARLNDRDVLEMVAFEESIQLTEYGLWIDGMLWIDKDPEDFLRVKIVSI